MSAEQAVTLPTGETLSMNEFERLLDGIIKSKRTELEKSKAAKELFCAFADGEQATTEHT